MVIVAVLNLSLIVFGAKTKKMEWLSTYLSLSERRQDAKPNSSSNNSMKTVPIWVFTMEISEENGQNSHF